MEPAREPQHRQLGRTVLPLPDSAAVLLPPLPRSAHAELLHFLVFVGGHQALVGLRDLLELGLSLLAVVWWW